MRLGSVVAAALAFSMAAPVAATTTLLIKQGGYFNNANVTVPPPSPGVGTQIAANFQIVGTYGGAMSGSFDLFAFCVDLVNEIALGNNTLANLSPQLNFEVGTLTTAPGLGPLTPTQVQYMKGLASYGFDLLKMSSPPVTLSEHIPAIQAAIWSIEYGKSITSSDPTINSLIGSYIALAPSLNGKATYIFSTDTNPRRQGMLIPYVPEPGTWAMMIAGFGLVGAAARRRRQDMSAVAA
ncbi:PEPxxWA-CTERM sorting domain-containing protein [Thermaurantiacus sp.]